MSPEHCSELDAAKGYCTDESGIHGCDEEGYSPPYADTCVPCIPYNNAVQYPYPMVPATCTTSNWPGYYLNQNDGCFTYLPLSFTPGINMNTGVCFPNYGSVENAATYLQQQPHVHQPELSTGQNNFTPSELYQVQDCSSSMPLAVAPADAYCKVTTNYAPQSGVVSTAAMAIADNIFYPAPYHQQYSKTVQDTMPISNSDLPCNTRTSANSVVKSSCSKEEPFIPIKRRYSLPSHRICNRAPNADQQRSSRDSSLPTECSKRTYQFEYLDNCDKLGAYASNDVKSKSSDVRLSGLSKSVVNLSDYISTDSPFEYSPALSQPTHTDVNSPPTIDSASTVSNRISVAKLLPLNLSVPKTLMKQYNYYQRLDLPPDCLGKPQLLSTHNHSPRGVEGVWRAHIDLLFRNLHEPWILSRAPEQFVPGQNWRIFKDLAKVRFYCQRCSDGWTSMFGVVVFYYRRNSSRNAADHTNRHTSSPAALDASDPAAVHTTQESSGQGIGAAQTTSGAGWGQILYKVAGQKCGRCNPDAFEMPLWYAEEAQKLKSGIGPKLVPFFKTVAIYFVVFIPVDQPSVFAAVLKALPVLSLIGFVLLSGMSFGDEYLYSRRILLGLLCSVVGDVLLVWDHLFLHGLGAFLVAQIFYISAFGFRPLNLHAAGVIYSVMVAGLVVLVPQTEGAMKVGVVVYALMLMTMVWRAVSRVQLFEELWTWTKLCSCAGGILFAFSDTCIGFHHYYAPLPYSQVMIMTTYYAAQLGISLSVVDCKASYLDSLKEVGASKAKAASSDSSEHGGHTPLEANGAADANSEALVYSNKSSVPQYFPDDNICLRDPTMELADTRADEAVVGAAPVASDGTPQGRCEGPSVTSAVEGAADIDAEVVLGGGGVDSNVALHDDGVHSRLRSSLHKV